MVCDKCNEDKDVVETVGDYLLCAECMRGETEALADKLVSEHRGKQGES